MKNASIFEGWKEFSFKNRDFRAEILGNNIYALYELYDNAYVYVCKFHSKHNSFNEFCLQAINHIDDLGD